MNYLLGVVTLLFFRPGQGGSHGAIAVVASPAAASSYDQSKPQPPISTDIYIYVPLLDFFQICKGVGELVVGVRFAAGFTAPNAPRESATPEI